MGSLIYDIAVVIVSWNAKAFLKQCLASIAATKESLSVQVIVVDNASSDGSPEMVASDFPYAILIRNKDNYGFAKANNIGIAECCAHYVCLINSDVKVLPDCLHSMVAFMDGNVRIGLVGPKILNSDGTVQPSVKRLPSPRRVFAEAVGMDRVRCLHPFFQGTDVEPRNLNAACVVPVLSGCFWMARHKALSDVGGLDERFFMYGEDNDWCKRYADAGWQVVYFPEAKAIHYGAGSSSNAAVRFFIELKRSQMFYLKKHHGSLGRSIGPVLVFVHCGIRAIGWMFLRVMSRSDSGRRTAMVEQYVKCVRWLFRF